MFPPPSLLPFPYADAGEGPNTGGFPLGCVPQVCLGSVFPWCQNWERREQDPGQDSGLFPGQDDASLAEGEITVVTASASILFARAFVSASF